MLYIYFYTRMFTGDFEIFNIYFYTLIFTGDFEIFKFQRPDLIGMLEIVWKTTSKKLLDETSNLEVKVLLLRT